MPIQTSPASATKYHLIAFDGAGSERTDDAAGMMSERILADIKAAGATDIFILSHGWQGDMPAAIQQYDKWIDAAARCTADLDALKNARPGFTPFTIGIHWPSLAWGDEEIPTGSVSFAPGASPLEGLVSKYAARLADTPAARTALRTIITAALTDIAPDTMPAEVSAAYTALNREAGLASGGPAAGPGADREPFDPERVYAAAQDSTSFGLLDNLGGLLAPLRTLTFWQMKDRAKAIGESAVHQLLQKIQQATGGDVRIHLMGHSFGCIVVSATLAGPGGTAPLVRPVNSLALVQGAFSLWSYCTDIPVALGQPGYFASVASGGKVSGPIVTTQSSRDTAVGTYYPIAAGLRGDVAFAAALPKYGGVGSFGLRGPGLDIVDLAMKPATDAYTLEPGKIYNLESTQYICDGGGTSGAHNDIAKSEVAHPIWTAAL